MSEIPRKTLSIKPKLLNITSESNELEKHSKGIQRGNKRIIKREQLPSTALPKTKSKSTKKPRKPIPKKPLVSPSLLRMEALNTHLNTFEVWRECRPLALGIEREIFQYIAQQRISASKRVVQKLLNRHTQQLTYQQNLALGHQRCHLTGASFP